MKLNNYENIDQYISNFPEDVQVSLRKIRETINSIVPEATEKISYGIPTIYLNGNLVHFAGYDNHIGFYPGANAIEYFSKDLINYKTSKGAIQFPLDKPIPFDLIKKITLYCVEINTNKK